MFHTTPSSQCHREGIPPISGGKRTGTEVACAFYTASVCRHHKREYPPMMGGKWKEMGAAYGIHPAPMWRETGGGINATCRPCLKQREMGGGMWDSCCPCWKWERNRGSVWDSRCPIWIKSPTTTGGDNNTFYSSTDSVGIREFRRNLQELTGIDWNLPESRGVYYKRYNITFGNDLYKGLPSFSKFFSYIFIN